MKVTLNWLKQYVDFDWSPDQLTERLTMLGLEVESARKMGGDLEGIVVAQILASDKHPNADKLSVCRVTDGKGERQIVCGAKNYKVGDKVPLALPGATLPTAPGAAPFTIKVGKIRGVESHGMMCSPKELGLAEDADGLMILPPEARVGQAFAEFLGKSGGDVVYDLEITPNRPDLNSVIGIAREISALTGNPLRLPALKDASATGGAASPGTQASAGFAGVRIEDADLCPRYIARYLRGVKVEPSPAWLKQILEKVGLRSINNVVDVTNFVMLETGQPLHAFDYHLLSPAKTGQPPVIVIRRANDGQKFVTLDGVERTLTGSVLLIADETKPIALAGVMGGRNTEINAETRDVLLESACFKPQNIRGTSRKLDLRTDASFRFERGCDPEMCDWASRRAAGLIAELAGGALHSDTADAWPATPKTNEVTLRFARTNALLGIDIASKEQIDWLSRLSLQMVEKAAAGAESITLRSPSYRSDLKAEVDLIEEVARLHGVEKIPATAPRGALGSSAFDSVHDELAEARRILAALGCFEFQTQTLVSRERAVREAAAWNGTPDQVLALSNPLSAEMDALRPTLLFGMLDGLRENVSHKTPDVCGFEIGRVFFRAPDGKVREERRLALALTGQRLATFWSGENRSVKKDWFDLKGVLEEFCAQFGVRGLTWARAEAANAFYLESAVIQLGKQVIGRTGQVIPAKAKVYDLPDPVLLAELDFDLLLARRVTKKGFAALPAFPAIRRDLAMIVGEETTHEMVLAAVKQAKPQNLEEIELFDVFRGKNVEPGKKSMAYAFTYRNSERTLTDAEVNAAHAAMVDHLKTALQAIVRE